MALSLKKSGKVKSNVLSITNNHIESSKMAEKKRIAIVSDFDGTITAEDFFDAVASRYLDAQALEPWQRYIKGELSHFDALSQIFSKIRVPASEFDRFIKAIPYDAAFAPTAAFCKEQDIPFYICSAGCDYYINLIIGDIITKNEIGLITNHGVYNPKYGLTMIAPLRSSPYYNAQVGISKAAIIKKLKALGYEVVFAGDGPPDIAPAQLSDVVFAKKYLLEKCQEINLETKKFDDYNDILAYLQEA